MKRVLSIAILLVVLALVPIQSSPSLMKVGSKKFTESVILGECIRLLCESTGDAALHLRELGGTKLVFDSLVNGEIDIYPEYSGTIQQEILGGQSVESIDDARRLLREQGVEISEPVGFNNTYALAMRRDRAQELGITKISELVLHPELSMGFSNEFLDREDGWKNLRTHYGLVSESVVGLDHDIAYRQLDRGVIDVLDVYSTDAKIQVYDLIVLQDDRAYFPRYDAVLLYRSDWARRLPDAARAALRLSGSIDGATMTRANAGVEVERKTESLVAADLVGELFSINVRTQESTRWQRLWKRSVEHLDLVRRSLLPAILIAIPVGVLAAKIPKLGAFILGGVGVIQTIPALALLVLLMPLAAALGLSSVGVGSATAILALLLYSLLPIVRNTESGLMSIAPQYQESALALGLPWTFRLVRIELPLALPSILAGIKTAAVMNVGFATLGALIGAGGYGQPIVTGIRLNDLSMILEGAVPAAIVALLVQLGFDAVERWMVPDEKNSA